MLSDVIPVLERMNLKVIGEHPYHLQLDGQTIWLHDFELQTDVISSADFNLLKQRFEHAFQQIWLGHADNDSFNGLVLTANLHWREVSVLRAYAAYMKQTLFPFSKLSIARALMASPHIARDLVDLFHHYFDPDCQHREIQRIEAQIEKALENIKSLNEDRILRRYLDLIHGTQRTNFYQKTVENKLISVLN